VALTIMLVLAGCPGRAETSANDASRNATSEETSEPTVTSNESDSAENNGARDRTITLAPETPSPQNAEASAPQSAADASRRARTKEFVVAGAPGDGLLPEENSIGPLADRFSEDSDRRAIYRTVTLFFETLAEGEMPTDPILPESRTSIRRSLDYVLSEGLVPEDYAIGAIVFDGDRARLNVSLYGNPGLTAGEVSVAAAEGRWYISDIQVDFAALAVEPTVEQFEPVSYDWQIHSR
jgi:hypothetical protein